MPRPDDRRHQQPRGIFIAHCPCSVSLHLSRGGTWIMLEPGWTVRDVKGGKAIEVSYERGQPAWSPGHTLGA
jgi:hypothetical protein